MKQIMQEQYVAAYVEWTRLKSRGQTQQRLGQYLMNTLVPRETNAAIFYCTDNDKSAKLFCELYVEPTDE